MSEIPEVFAIFEQKLAHVLSFTVVPLKSKDLKNALEEILTYFSGIVERASKAESRIAELEAENAELKERVAMLDVTAVFKSLGEMGYIEQTDKLHTRIAELEAEIDEFLFASSNVLNPYDGISVPYEALKKLVKRVRKER